MVRDGGGRALDAGNVAGNGRGHGWAFLQLLCSFMCTPTATARARGLEEDAPVK